MERASAPRHCAVGNLRRSRSVEESLPIVDRKAGNSLAPQLSLVRAQVSGNSDRAPLNTCCLP